MMNWFGMALLLLIAVSGFMVVRTRNVSEQAIALTFYGLLTGLMFFVFQAPDVALSQLTVGAVALPLMVMLAVARMHFHRQSRERAEKQRRQKEGQAAHE